MKAKRLKQSKRQMTLYQKAFGFRAPYQILLDGNFLHTAFLQKLTPADLERRLSRLLLGPVRLMVTVCTLQELHALGPDFRSTNWHARHDFEHRICRHAEAQSAAVCLSSLIGEANSYRYCVATQDQALRHQLREKVGVPLLYMNHGVLILEPPSQTTMDAANHHEQAKLIVPNSDKALTLLKEKFAVEESIQKPLHKRKKAKGPNPLSVQKTKKEKKKSIEKPEPQESVVKLEGNGNVSNQDADQQHSNEIPLKKRTRGTRGGRNKKRATVNVE